MCVRLLLNFSPQGRSLTLLTASAGGEDGEDLARGSVTGSSGGRGAVAHPAAGRPRYPEQVPEACGSSPSR